MRSMWSWNQLKSLGEAGGKGKEGEDGWKRAGAGGPQCLPAPPL